MCKVFGPPSQHERWCCTIFKTSNLNKEYENLPGNSLTFLGIRHSESVARAGYDRTQEISKISSQVNAMPIIEWKDYDVWLYILAKNLLNISIGLIHYVVMHQDIAYALSSVRYQYEQLYSLVKVG